MLKITRDTDMGKFHWGLAPIPEHTELIGTVQRETGSAWIWGAALLRFTTTGVYVSGAQGTVRTLPQHEVKAALDVQK